MTISPLARGSVAAVLCLMFLALGFGLAAPGSATPSQRSDEDSYIEAARHDRSHVPGRCPYAMENAAYPPFTKTTACVRYAGTGRRVLIVGDSHAEHWVPAFMEIARRRNWQLSSLTRPGCGPLNYVAVRPDDRNRPTVGVQCYNWRQTVYPTVIRRFDPQLVLFGGRTQNYDIRSDGRVISRTAQQDKWFAKWKGSWRWTVRVLHSHGARLGALSLQPTVKEDVPNCLHREGLYSNRCDTATSFDGITNRLNVFVRNIRQPYPSVRPVRGTSLVCPRSLCKAVRDRTITYRDQSHLTATFARSLNRRMSRLLVSVGLAPATS